MTFKNLATAAAIVSGLYALCTLFLPGEFLKFIGATGSSVLLVRWLGSAAIGYTVLAWQARNLADMAAQRTVSITLMTAYLVGFVVTLIEQMGEGALTNNWINAVLFLLLGGAFGYLVFMRPSSA
jgi:hypothetical protein